MKVKKKKLCLILTLEFLFFFGFQEGIEPLPVEDVNKVWEHMRDYGILVGKGGIFGNVRRPF